MQIKVEVSDHMKTRFQRFEKKAKYAMKNGINTTVQDAQKAQRMNLNKSFTVRRKDWVEKNVKIKPFATREKLFSQIMMQAPGIKYDRDDVLQKFENPSIKKPRDGRSLAVPKEAKRGKTAVVTASNRPKNLLSGARQKNGKAGKSRMKNKPLTIRRNTSMVVLLAKNGVFAVKRSDGSGGIFKRMGKKGSKRKQLKVLYKFIPRAKLKERLSFYDVVGGHVRRNVVPNVMRAWNAEFARK